MHPEALQVSTSCDDSFFIISQKQKLILFFLFCVGVREALSAPCAGSPLAWRILLGIIMLHCTLVLILPCACKEPYGKLWFSLVYIVTSHVWLCYIQPVCSKPLIFTESILEISVFSYGDLVFSNSTSMHNLLMNFIGHFDAMVDICYTYNTLFTTL